MPDRRLILIGEGWGTTEFDKLIAGHKNIEWLGYQDDDSLVKYISEAKACIFAAKEDFGIMCVESQACGTPVLALNYGGYRETVVDNTTGYLFAAQNEQSIIDAVNKFEAKPLTAHRQIRENAMRFSDDRFYREFEAFVNKARKEFKP